MNDYRSSEVFRSPGGVRQGDPNGLGPTRSVGDSSGYGVSGLFRGVVGVQKSRVSSVPPDSRSDAAADCSYGGATAIGAGQRRHRATLAAPTSSSEPSTSVVPLVTGPGSWASWLRIVTV